MSQKDPNGLHEKVKRFIPIEGNDAIRTDAAMTEFLLDNCEIYFTPDSTFFCQTDLGHDNYPQYYEVLQPRFTREFAPFADTHYQELIDSKTLDMRFDFGHTCPNWQDVITLGFAGLRDRAVAYAEQQEQDLTGAAGENQAQLQTSQKNRFYTSVLKVYNAAERFIGRVIQKAEEKTGCRLHAVCAIS